MFDPQDFPHQVELSDQLTTVAIAWLAERVPDTGNHGGQDGCGP